LFIGTRPVDVELWRPFSITGRRGQAGALALRLSLCVTILVERRGRDLGRPSDALLLADLFLHFLSDV
jgi:hypothetical protein